MFIEPVNYCDYLIFEKPLTVKFSKENRFLKNKLYKGPKNLVYLVGCK